MAYSHNQPEGVRPLQRARRCKSELLSRMLSNEAIAERAPRVADLPTGSNIVGVGYGPKITGGGALFGDEAVRVYVRKKLPTFSLSESERVPSEAGGLPTDVIETGDITALSRPTECGVSVGHYAISAGTLGCLLRREGSEEDYILSNNHVLADSNEAEVGDAILQPGPADGGERSRETIAELTDFEAIDFSGANTMDAAIARVTEAGAVLPEIKRIGRVQGSPKEASLYESVRKHGRTTRHTVGVVDDLAADIRVRYERRSVSFEDQIAITGAGGEFSAGGDSGSLVVDAIGRRAVALLFAGGSGTTFANPITGVLERFGTRII